jgi:hypothetical protein
VSLILLIVGAVVLLFGFVVAFGAPYVPSLRKEVSAAFSELYPLGADDMVVDLGSGDGSVLLAASKTGARCVGVELNPILVALSRLRLGMRADIRLSNMWLMVLPPETTLVYAFVVSRDTKRLEKFLQKEANRLQKEIHLMTFGAALPSVQPIRIRKAHSLYSFKPLQVD